MLLQQEKKTTSFKESLLAQSSNKFDKFRDKFSKLRGGAAEATAGRGDEPTTAGAKGQEGGEAPSQNSSFTHGLAKILHRWKSEHEGGGQGRQLLSSSLHSHDLCQRVSLAPDWRQAS